MTPPAGNLEGRINAFLRSRGSPLAPYASAFVQAGNRYGIDPRLLVGIAGIESSFGTYGPTARIHNPFGYGPNVPFPSWQAAIDAAAKRLTGSNYRGKDVLGIAETWAPASAGNDPKHWASVVASVMQQIGGTAPSYGTAAVGPGPLGGATGAAPTIDRAALTRGLLAAFQANGGINTSALMAAITKSREQPHVEPAPTHPGPAGDTVTTAYGQYPADFKGQYPKMIQGGRSPYSNLTFAGHTDWVHVDSTLLDRLNILGRRLGVHIFIESGYRSPGYSAGVGGYSTDPHTRGVAVDASINGVPIGDFKDAFQILHELGLESGAQPNFYRGKRDPAHVQVPGSGVNKRIHAKRTHAAWR